MTEKDTASIEALISTGDIGKMLPERRLSMKALLEAICADEASDSPRLVYADALMQSGDETMHARGKLIVIQCKLAQTNCPPGERKELEARERELLDAHKSAWLAEFKLTEEEAASVVFYRGFIDKVVMSLVRFVKVAPALAMNPLLVLSSPYTRAMKTFEPLSSKAMLRVKHLNLDVCNISDEGAKAIAQSECLRNITHLDLWSNNISYEGATAIAQAEYLQNLTHLGLSYNNISDEGAKAIAQSECLRNLTHLDLRSNNISDEGAVAIAQSEHLRNITHLDLQYNVISDEAVSLIRNRWPFVHI